MPKKTSSRAAKKAAQPAKRAARKTAAKVAAKVTAKKSTPKKAAAVPVKKNSTQAVKKTAKKTAAKTRTPKPVKPSTPKAAAKKTLKKTAPGKAKAPADARVAGTEKKDADDSKPAPIVFSLEDVEQLMAARKREPLGEAGKRGKAVKKTVLPQSKPVTVEDKPHERRKLGAASLADILGFNPAEKKKNTALSSEEVPKKWKRYYKQLIDLRLHVRDEIDLHSTETLKHSAREDSGDLSSYSSHQADAGTDNFDRDFALSLVSSEHEALNEIEDAILRIKKGTYGVCEVTGKPIPAARLSAVPFARYSVEGQAEYEKNLRRKIDRGGSSGFFGDTSDVPKIAADDEDE